MTGLKIALTGASGFIGRHVLNELPVNAASVTCMTRNASKLADIRRDFQVVELDLVNPNIDSYERLGKPDLLIHLAWDGLPNYQSLHHFECELPRHYLFLKRLIESGLPSLLVAGTCLEYGMQSGELSEELVTIPNNPYGYAKDALRQQLEFLQQTHPFALTWARLFYTFGEGQAQNSLFPALKKAVTRGDKIFDMSGGEQLRDYLPIGDIATILVNLACQQSDIGVINICSGIPISIRTLVENWLKENNWAIKLNLGYYSYMDYEPLAFWGDRRKLDRYLHKTYC